MPCGWGTRKVSERPSRCLVRAPSTRRAVLGETKKHRGARRPRSVPEAIIERFGRAADAMLVPITEGSTLPVVSKTAPAGLIEVQRWTFLL